MFVLSSKVQGVTKRASCPAPAAGAPAFLRFKRELLGFLADCPSHTATARRVAGPRWPLQQQQQQKQKQHPGVCQWPQHSLPHDRGCCSCSFPWFTPPPLPRPAPPRRGGCRELREAVLRAAGTCQGLDARIVGLVSPVAASSAASSERMAPASWRLPVQPVPTLPQPVPARLWLSCM